MGPLRNPGRCLLRSLRYLEPIDREFAINTNGSVDVMDLVLVVVTVLLDLGLVGAGSKTRWKE